MGQSSSRSINCSLPEQQSEAESAGTKRPGEDLSTRSVKRGRTNLDTSQPSSLDPCLGTRSKDQDNPSLLRAQLEESRKGVDLKHDAKDSAKDAAQLEESRKEVDQLRLDLKDAKKLFGTLAQENKSLLKRTHHQELASLNRKLNESAKEVALLDESRKEVEESRKEVDRMGLDLKNAKKQVGALAQENKNKEEIKRTQQQEVASLNLKLNESAKEVALLLDESRKEVEESRKEVDRMGLVLNDAKKQVGALAQENKSLLNITEKKWVFYNDSAKEVAQLEKSRKEVDRLGLDLKDAKKLVGTLALENKSLLNITEKKEEEIKRTQREVNKLTLELDTFKKIKMANDENVKNKIPRRAPRSKKNA
jgi:DNA repair exonuclease SbcCD ATPase subunit